MFTGEETFGQEAPALREALADLRSRGDSLLVALTHLDLDEERAIAREVPELTLVLGGHDHDPASVLEHGVLLLRAGSNADWLGKVHLVVQPAAAPGELARVLSIGWSLVPNVGVPPSPRLAPLVAAVEERLSKTMDEALATLGAPLDSRTGTVRTGEAAIGNLVADALRAHFGADAAIINGGGLRSDRHYPAGHVFTRRDLAREMPFGNSIVLLEVSDTELRQALENGLSEGRPGGRGRAPGPRSRVS